MIYDHAMIAQLAQRCAPEVATEAVVPLVVTESGGNTLQINVNKGPRVQAASVERAATLVSRYMAAGYTVDVGLAQVNSGNFARFGVSVEQAFEPCTNLRLASAVLQEGYARASRVFAGLDAISATYSLYNSGSMTRGLRNGYVGRVWANAAASGAIDAAPSLAVTQPSGSATHRADTQVGDSPRWVVGQIDASVEVFK